jgi:predicted RND superfamily exporter protein
MERFGGWLARRPLVVVLANVAITFVLGAWALQLRIENSLESMLPTADPKVEYYNETRAIFGSDDVGVVGVRAADIFAPDTIEKIARVTDALGKVPGVEGVVSITNVVDRASTSARRRRVSCRTSRRRPRTSRRSSGGSRRRRSSARTWSRTTSAARRSTWCSAASPTRSIWIGASTERSTTFS